jgi:hypothetical protein
MKTLTSRVCFVSISDKWDDVPPKKESNYNVSLEGQKGGINGQKEFHSRADHQ